MKKLRITIVSLTVAVLVAMVGVVVGIGLTKKAQAAELTVQTQLKEKYSLNEWFDVPTGTITVNGNSAQADVSVKLPDGELTRKQGFFLTLSGRYMIIYTATVNGKTYVKQTEIKVDGENVSAKIAVDCKGYAPSSLPMAEVGKPYEIFTATATVGKTRVDVVADVYFLYGEKSGLKIETANGKFVPERKGTYEIRYFAENFNGEKTETVLTVKAVDDAKELAVTPAEITGVAGETLSFGAAVSSDDRTGKRTLTVKAKYSDGEEIIYDGEYASEQNVTYVFERTGDISLEWTLCDYSRTVTTTSVAAISSPAPAFDKAAEGFSLEPAFLADRTYKLPEVFVKSYDESGVKYEKSDVTLTYDNGKTESVSDDFFTITDETASTLTVRWTKGELEKSVTVPVKKLVTDDGIDTSALFVVKSGALTVGETGVVMDFAKHRNKDVGFVNKVYVSRFTTILDASKVGVGRSFEIRLVDEKDKDNKLSVKIAINGTGLTVTNNVDSSVGKVNAVNGAAGEITFSYAEATKTITVTNGGVGDGNETKINLKGFKGFSSEEAFLIFSTTSNNAQLVISRINGQRLNKISKDANLPQLIRKGSYLPETFVGEEIELFPAYGLDVIDGYRPAKVSVKNHATGEYLKSEDGVVLNGATAARAYKIKVKERMNIRIQYTSKDLSKNEASEVMYVTAIGGESPSLTVGEVAQTVAKRGDKLILPETTATHPQGMKVNIFVVVFDPDGKGQIPAENGYTFDKKGTYKILITASDEEGNIAEYYYYTEVV